MRSIFNKPMARTKRRVAVAVALLVLLVGVFALLGTETLADDLSPVYLSAPRNHYAVLDNDRIYIPITLDNSGPDADAHPHVVSLEAEFLDGNGGFVTGFSKNEFGTPLDEVLAPDQTPVTNGVNVPRGAPNKVIVYLWVAAPVHGSDLAPRQVQVNGYDNYGLAGDSNVTRQRDGLALVLYVHGVKLEDGEIALDEYSLAGDRKLYQGVPTDWNFTLQNPGYTDQSFTVSARAYPEGASEPAKNWTFDFEEQGARASDGSYDLDGTDKLGEAQNHTFIVTITAPFHSPLGNYDIQLLLNGANVTKSDRTTAIVQPLVIISTLKQDAVPVTVDTWDEDAGTARVDFLALNDILLQEGQTKEVDTDGDGDSDTRVTLTGFDPQGVPIVTMVPIEAADDDDDDWYGAAWCIPFLLLLLLILLILLLLCWLRKRPVPLAALPPTPPPMPHLLASVGEQMEPGFLYYVDERGNIARVPETEVESDRRGERQIDLRRKIGLDPRPLCMIYYKDIDPDLIMPKSVPRARGKGKVSTLNLQREPGYFYYIDKNGDISRSKMARGTEPGGHRELIMKVGVVREPEWFYFIDSDGDISRTRRVKGGKEKFMRLEGSKEDEEPAGSLVPMPGIEPWKVASVGVWMEPDRFYSLDANRSIVSALIHEGHELEGRCEVVIPLIEDTDHGYFVLHYYPEPKLQAQAVRPPRPKPRPRTESPAPIAPSAPAPRGLCLENYGLTKEPGYFYYVDSQGHISRNLMAKGPEPAGPTELMAETGIEREPGWLYYVDKQGCIQKAKMRRGPAKSKLAEREALPEPSPPKPRDEPKAPAPPKLCLEDFGLKKEPGYFYYVDSDGHISRNLMARGPEPAGPRELMAKTGIERETGWLYYVNKQGCIQKARMRRGPPRSKQTGK